MSEWYVRRRRREIKTGIIDVATYIGVN